MKATGVVRRIDERVIISLRQEIEENQGVPLILSKKFKRINRGWQGCCKVHNIIKNREQNISKTPNKY
jgi:hypothetical protein